VRSHQQSELRVSGSSPRFRPAPPFSSSSNAFSQGSIRMGTQESSSKPTSAMKDYCESRIERYRSPNNKHKYI